MQKNMKNLEKKQMINSDFVNNIIETCKFKSKIGHRTSSGCQSTLLDIVCPGEDKCILYQI